MGKDPIQIQVTGKEIQQEPLDRLIVQGELNATDIVFTLDRYVDGIDLAQTGMAYQIYGVNQNNQSAYNSLVKGTVTDPNKFTLRWIVGNQFTVAHGPLRLWINASKSEGGKVVLNWQSKRARIFIGDGFILSDYISVTEQLLIDLATMVSQAQAAAAASGNSASMSAISETNARNSAVNADASKAAAATSATASATSATNASSSATLASGRATAASDSAAHAKTSEANSKASELAAKISEDSANIAAQSSESFAIQAQQIKDSTEMLHDVQETRVGFKRRDEESFTYTEDLTGPLGPRGPQGNQGPAGPTGEKGDRGETGLTMLAEGLFLFYVTTDGFLICRYDERSEPPSFRINASGNLIWEAAAPVMNP